MLFHYGDPHWYLTIIRWNGWWNWESGQLAALG